MLSQGHDYQLGTKFSAIHREFGNGRGQEANSIYGHKDCLVATFASYYPRYRHRDTTV
jgi:hypothetical protein